MTFTFSLGPQIQAFLAVASSSVHAQLIADSQLNQPDCVSVGVCVCVWCRYVVCVCGVDMWCVCVCLTCYECNSTPAFQTNLPPFIPPQGTV